MSSFTRTFSDWWLSHCCCQNLILPIWFTCKKLSWNAIAVFIIKVNVATYGCWELLFSCFSWDVNLRRLWSHKMEKKALYDGPSRLPQFAVELVVKDSKLIAFKGTQSRLCACARVWFLFRRSRIQRCENWYRAFTNPFASSSINFGFALKLLRIKDQWDTVLIKCQFVCNRDLSVLTSMPFGWTSSGGKCYGAGRRRLSPGSFQKGLENRDWKGLKSYGTSNMAEVLQRNRFTRLGKDWKDRARASVSLLTFYSSKQTFTR